MRYGRAVAGQETFDGIATGPQPVRNHIFQNNGMLIMPVAVHPTIRDAAPPAWRNREHHS